MKIIYSKNTVIGSNELSKILNPQKRHKKFKSRDGFYIGEIVTRHPDAKPLINFKYGDFAIVAYFNNEDGWCRGAYLYNPKFGNECHVGEHYIVVNQSMIEHVIAPEYREKLAEFVRLLLPVNIF